ncbi:22298_t:CDS:1, partial [Cetraspora pellucida]
TTQEDLLPDTEMLPRDELAIYGYRTPHLSASRIPKAASSFDKNEETD